MGSEKSDVLVADCGERWFRVIEAGDCEPCDMCGELICQICGDHYANCPCPGPREEDEFKYRYFDGVLYARTLEALPE